ncbi:MAG: hypothetical protein KIH69_008790 [Anaerolineae bacterium]|nr:hypothetical protein [Anaerolineae bacterium]
MYRFIGQNAAYDQIVRRIAPAWGSIPTLRNNAGFTGWGMSLQIILHSD